MLFRLEFHQTLSVSPTRAWEFLSSPKNLRDITPKSLGFEILSSLPDRMYPGLVIQYRVSPLLGLLIPWVTEITHVSEGKYFIDEQRFGPYRFWHHQHHLRETADGTEMHDILHYALWAPPFDRLLNIALVRPKILEIFSYREKILRERSW